VNLYLAAVWTNQYCAGQPRNKELTDREKDIFANIPFVLESYHYVEKQQFVDAMRANGAKVFLDSGAFSAKSLGVDIDINAYCDYIKRNIDIIKVEDGVVMASVLDGIGDPLKTWQNQLYMEAQGAKPLPCFHFGEDERYLEWYVERYEYITIGGMVRTKAEDVMQWLDRIWNRYLVDGAGRPKVKAHAFGVTTISLMERYPWHSVDSSSWIQATAFGSIYTSEYGPICVSDQSPSRQDMGRHFNTYSEIEKRQLHELLEAKGFNYERLSKVYQSRAGYNAMGYVELGVLLNEHFAQADGILDCAKMQQLF
jgi:hypothetical protein